MPSLLFTIVAFIVALGILVSVHEFGHFWVARRLGVKVLRFSVGFGKPFWRYQANENSTEYVLAAIPLGGYVKMLDEREGEVAPEERHLAFNTQSVYKRIAIVAAGPIFNFLLAILLYFIVASLGINDFKPIIGELKQGSIAEKSGLQYEDKILSVNNKSVISWSQARVALIDEALDADQIQLEVERNKTALPITLDLDGQKLLKDNQDVVDSLGINIYMPKSLKPQVGELVKGMPAEQAGLKIGDLVLSVDGQPINSWKEWVEYVQERPNQAIAIQIQRQASQLDLTIKPNEKKVESGTIGFVGMGVQSPVKQLVQYPFVDAIQYSVAKTWDMSVLLLKMIGKLIVGDVSHKNISGPLSIAEYAGKTASINYKYYIDFIAVISISLGVLNLLPIPMLDGGHLAYFATEIVTGKQPSEKVQLILQQFGMIILVMIMVLAFTNDITRLFL